MVSHANKKIATKSSSKNIHRDRFVFDATHGHGLCMLDAEGTIISWNTIAERLFGYTSHEVVGKKYSFFFEKKIAATRA